MLVPIFTKSPREVYSEHCHVHFFPNMPYHTFCWVMVWPIWFGDLLWEFTFPYISLTFGDLPHLFWCPIHCKDIWRSTILNELVWCFTTIDFLVDGIPVHKDVLVFEYLNFFSSIMDFVLVYIWSVAIFCLNLRVKYILSILYCHSSGIKDGRSSLLVISFTVCLAWGTLICQISLIYLIVFYEWGSLKTNAFGGCIYCLLSGGWIATSLYSVQANSLLLTLSDFLLLHLHIS